MSKRVKLDKSELIDIILEEVEKELTDEATSLGQKDPKYKKFPSTIYYDDVADEYRAILPVVEKLLEANPQDRPYVADALEMMMFNVREGIHGPEMDESKLDEEGSDHRRNQNPAAHDRRPKPAPRNNRVVNLAKSLSVFLKAFEKYEKTGDERWLPTLKSYLSKFGGQDSFGGEPPPTALRDVRTAAEYLADERGLGDSNDDKIKDAKTKFVAQVMIKAKQVMTGATPSLPSDDELKEASLPDTPYRQQLKRIKDAEKKNRDDANAADEEDPEKVAYWKKINAKVAKKKAKAAKPSLMQRAKDAASNLGSALPRFEEQENE